MSDPAPIPLAVDFSVKSANGVRAELVNCYVDVDEKAREVHVTKRPGTTLHQAHPTGTPLGLFVWKTDLYAVIDSTVYKNGVALTGSVNTAGGFYSFASGLGPSPKLFLHNRTNGYVIDGAGTLTAITDVDFPPNQTPARPIVPGAVYLNGVFYVMDEKSEFANSDATTGDDPAVWEAFTLAAEFDGDEVVAIAKQLVYVLVFKKYSIEAFADLGNSVGVPLSAVGSAKLVYGLREARTLVDCGGELFFVSQTREGGACVVRLASLAPVIVSNAAVDIFLDQTFGGQIYGWSARVKGHRFYGLTAPAKATTLVYDITAGVWYRWSGAGAAYFPYVFSSAGPDAQALLMHETSGDVDRLDPNASADLGTAFLAQITTPPVTQELRTAIGGRLDVLADKATGAQLTIEFFDNDSAIASASQTVDLGLDRPSIADLGSFFRRQFRLSTTSILPFRAQKLILYTDAGT